MDYPSVEEPPLDRSPKDGDDQQAFQGVSFDEVEVDDDRPPPA